MVLTSTVYLCFVVHLVATQLLAGSATVLASDSLAMSHRFDSQTPVRAAASTNPQSRRLTHSEWHDASPMKLLSATKIAPGTDAGFNGDLDAEDGFGTSIAFLGNLSAGAHDTFAIGAPYDDEKEVGGGATWLVQVDRAGMVQDHRKIPKVVGGNTQIEGSVGGMYEDMHFGMAVASLGQLDPEGAATIAVGAPGDRRSINTNHPPTGSVTVISLASNGDIRWYQVISDWDGDFEGTVAVGDLFGSSVTSLGQIKPDAPVTIVVGAPGTHASRFSRGEAGAIWVLDLRSSGTVIRSQKIGSREGGIDIGIGHSQFFGCSLSPLAMDSPADNVLGERSNNNAVASFLVGAPANRYGSGGIWILHLKSDNTVIQYSRISRQEGGFEGMLETDDGFGRSVLDLGHVDPHSMTTIAVGAYP